MIQENELKNKDIDKNLQVYNYLLSQYNENLSSTEREKDERKNREEKLQKEHDILIDKIDQKKMENEKLKKKELPYLNGQVQILAKENEKLQKELFEEKLRSNELTANLSSEKDLFREAINKTNSEKYDLQSKVDLLKNETERYQTLIKGGEKSLSNYLANEENKRKEIDKLMDGGKSLIHELREENKRLETEKKELIEQRSHVKETHVPLKDFQEIKEALMKVEQEKFELKKELIIKGGDNDAIQISSHNEQDFVRSLKKIMGKAGIKYSKEENPKTLMEAFSIVNKFFEEEDFS